MNGGLGRARPPGALVGGGGVESVLGSGSLCALLRIFFRNRLLRRLGTAAHRFFRVRPWVVTGRSGGGIDGQFEGKTGHGARFQIRQSRSLPSLPPKSPMLRRATRNQSCWKQIRNLAVSSSLRRNDGVCRVTASGHQKRCVKLSRSTRGSAG